MELWQSHELHAAPPTRAANHGRSREYVWTIMHTKNKEQDSRRTRCSVLSHSFDEARSRSLRLESRLVLKLPKLQDPNPIDSHRSLSIFLFSRPLGPGRCYYTRTRRLPSASVLNQFNLTSMRDFELAQPQCGARASDPSCPHRRADHYEDQNCRNPSPQNGGRELETMDAEAIQEEGRFLTCESGPYLLLWEQHIRTSPRRDLLESHLPKSRVPARVEWGRGEGRAEVRKGSCAADPIDGFGDSSTGLRRGVPRPCSRLRLRLWQCDCGMDVSGDRQSGAP